MKRFTLGLLFVLLMVVPTSVANAHSQTSKPISLRPLTPCISTNYQIKSNSGWVHTGYDNVDIYAQVWVEYDNNAPYEMCGHIRTKGGIWFHSTYTTCRTWDQRQFAQIQGSQFQVQQDNEGQWCGSNGDSVQIWGTPVNGYSPGEICDPVQAQTHDDTNSVYTWAYWDCFD